MLFLSRQIHSQSCFENNYSIGKYLVNKLIITENDSFDFIGSFTLSHSRGEYLQGSQSEEINVVLESIRGAIKKIPKNGLPHFIFAAWNHVENHPKIQLMIQNELKNSKRSQSFILTFVRKENYYCITKEKFIELNEKGGKIGPYTVKKSIGDDLEEFCEKIFKQELIDNDVGFRGRGNFSYHLSLLTDTQKEWLEGKLYPPTMPPSHKSERFRTSFKHSSFDVPEAEMIKSESTSKYCAALCVRSTYIIRTKDMNGGEHEESKPDQIKTSESTSDLCILNDSIANK